MPPKRTLQNSEEDSSKKAKIEDFFGGGKKAKKPAAEDSPSSPIQESEDASGAASSSSAAGPSEPPAKAEVDPADATWENFDKSLSPLWNLSSELNKPSFKSLKAFLLAEHKAKTPIYPSPSNVFTALNECSFDNVRVVILGQDPYHAESNQAHGLSFSVQKGVQPPPSLVNMFKELVTDIPGFKTPRHGCLIKWSRQGVLMLNAVLTVKAKTAGSHRKKGWEEFTQAILNKLNREKKGIVFLLWGADAHKVGDKLDSSKHHILKGVHPSPLSAHRGWFGCKHFSKCNDLLKKDGHQPIDWTLDE